MKNEIKIVKSRRLRIGKNHFPVGIVVTAVLLIGLSSCFKEKPLAPPSNAGIGQTNTINMGPGYGDQFFYSLATNKVISSNSRLAYDLMFDDNPNTFNIWLNSANSPTVCPTGQYNNLDSVTFRDTIGHGFRCERGSYNTDSNAIGQWWEPNSNPPTSLAQVYIINLGVDSVGHALGFVKLLVNNFLDGYYNISFEDMNNQNKHTSWLIKKDAGYNYNYLYFSFKDSVVNIEPNRHLWDLEFTHYTCVFYIPQYLPYPVTGVLSNPSRVSAYLYADTTTNFDSIKIKNFNPALLQTNRDAIGYLWKRYDGTYTVLDHYTYFIQTGSNTIYKLHFVGYYNKGNDGYPAFEYFQL